MGITAFGGPEAAAAGSQPRTARSQQVPKYTKGRGPWSGPRPVAGVGGVLVAQAPDWRSTDSSRSFASWARAWWPQKRSSPPDGSTARTFAAAPQRSQRSAAVSSGRTSVPGIAASSVSDTGTPGALTRDFTAIPRSRHSSRRSGPPHVFPTQTRYPSRSFSVSVTPRGVTELHRASSVFACRSGNPATAVTRRTELFPLGDHPGATRRAR